MNTLCSSCGAEVPDGATTCPECKIGLVPIQPEQVEQPKVEQPAQAEIKTIPTPDFIKDKPLVTSEMLAQAPDLTKEDPKVVESLLNPLNSSASLSPMPINIPPKTMDFPEAIREIMNLKKVTRTLWNDINEYALLQDGWLMIHTKGQDHKWTINDGDLEGTDWTVIP